MSRKVYGISFNDDQQAFLKKLMDKAHYTNKTQFFIYAMGLAEQELFRRGPGRPKNSEDEEPEDTTQYMWPEQDMNKGRVSDKDGVEWYFSMRHERVPADYYEKNKATQEQIDNWDKINPNNPR